MPSVWLRRDVSLEEEKRLSGALQARNCARAGRAGRAERRGRRACVGRVQPLWIWAKASASESGIEPEPSERCSACVRKVAARAPMRQPARKVPSAIVRPHGARAGELKLVTLATTCIPQRSSSSQEFKKRRVPRRQARSRSWACSMPVLSASDSLTPAAGCAARRVPCPPARQHSRQFRREGS